MRQNDETENMYPISKYVRTIKALIIALGFYCWRNVWDLDCWDFFLLETVNHSSRQDIIVVVDLGKQLGIGSRGMHMHSFSITKRFSYVQTLSIATVTYVEAGPFHFRSISNKHR